jgi:thiol-disulfide isomerase/thioredoxin
MDKNSLKYLWCTILALTVCTAVHVLAQTPARMGPASADKIKKAKSTLEANLNSFDAHSAYIYAMGMKNPDLFTQYEIWMKKYPENINIPLSIGTVYNKAAMPGAEFFLLKAAAMDSLNAKVWAMLASDAHAGGRSDLETEYWRKATLVEPSNASYAYGYLKTFENDEPDAYKKKVFDFVQRFPTNEFGAHAMYRLAGHSPNLADEIHYLEVLRELYPPEKFTSTIPRLRRLADFYLQTDTEKALLLISEIDNGPDWTARKQLAELLIKVDKLEKDQNYRGALAALDTVKLPGYNHIKDFITLKKASLREQTGDVRGAYDSLSVKFAKLPTDALYNALKSYGTKLGKSKEQVVKDIEVIRDRTATTAYPFKLGLYTSNDSLDLSKLKGKVVLLTFWFPTCGPCLEEFPHFQTVVDSFKGDSLVYIGINVTPAQDGFVLPFLKNRKFSFIPLRGSSSFARENYGAYGAPVNFVIDKDGMIIFKSFTIGNRNLRTLELMISSLLEKESTKL